MQQLAINKAMAEISVAMVKRKLFALIGSGGGFRGGFVRAMIDVWLAMGLPIDALFGISVNALQFAFLAMGKWELVAQWWKDIDERGRVVIYDSTFFDETFNPNVDQIIEAILPNLNVFTLWRLRNKESRRKLVQEAMARANKIRSLATNQAMFDLLIKHVQIEDFKIPFYFGVVELKTGKYHCLTPQMCKDDYNAALAIGASATMPGVWLPVPKIELADGTTLYECVDGGVTDNLNAADFIKFVNARGDSAEDWQAVAMCCSSGECDEAEVDKMNVIGIVFRALEDINLANQLNKTISRTEEISSMVRQAAPKVLANPKTGEPYHAFNLTVIKPKTGELGSTLESDRETLKRNYQAGERIAREIFENITAA